MYTCELNWVWPSHTSHVKLRKKLIRPKRMEDNFTCGATRYIPGVPTNAIKLPCSLSFSWRRLHAFPVFLRIRKQLPRTFYVHAPLHLGATRAPIWPELARARASFSLAENVLRTCPSTSCRERFTYMPLYILAHSHGPREGRARRKHHRSTALELTRTAPPLLRDSSWLPTSSSPRSLGRRSSLPPWRSRCGRRSKPSSASPAPTRLLPSACSR
jgi:hypothetical protein